MLYSHFDCLIPWLPLCLNLLLPSVYRWGITVTPWAEACEIQRTASDCRLCKPSPSPAKPPGAGYTVCTQHYLTSASRMSRVSRRAWLTGTNWKREGGSSHLRGRRAGLRNGPGIAQPSHCLQELCRHIRLGKTKHGWEVTMATIGTQTCHQIFQTPMGMNDC